MAIRDPGRGAPPGKRKWPAAVRAGMLVLVLLLPASPGRAAPPLHVEVVGGLASLRQYEGFERPFWLEEVPRLTQGRLTAGILPFDRAGMRGAEMLELMRLRVISFANIQVGLAAAEDPELNAMDLPGLSPDLPALRDSVARWRGQLGQLLSERYGLVLLAVYAYPPQVTFCREPFAGLPGLAGRRVRVSSVGQSEFLQALGAIPVVIPFAGITEAVRAGVVDCAVTGAISGNVLGLHRVTRALSGFAVSWGVAFFAANRDAWEELPPDIRQPLAAGLARLESSIWADLERQTDQGLLCNTGQPACRDGERGTMQLVEDPADLQALRARLLSGVVLPRWIARCGQACAESWNTVMAGPTGVRLGQ